MPTIIHDQHGFHDNLTPTPLVKETIKIIADQVSDKFPNEINLVADGTWLDSPKSYDNLKEIYLQVPRIDNFFIVGTVDKIHTYGINYPSNPDLKLFQIGTICDDYFHPYRLEWGIWSAVKLFKKYTDEELKLFYSPNIKPYICYQNKPHLHRQQLTYKLLKEGLLDKGIITLKKNPGEEFIYPELTELSVEEFIERQYYLHPNEYIDPYFEKQIPYSLGELKYWQNSFLNVVSETFANDGSTPYITEKTVKPILGLRPFIINGNYRIERQLNQRAVIIYDFLWKLGVPLEEWITDDNDKIVDNCVKVIKNLCSWSNQEIYNYYRNDLYKVCLSNRDHLIGLANDTEIKMRNIFKNFTRYSLPNQNQEFVEKNLYKLQENGINI